MLPKKKKIVPQRYSNLFIEITKLKPKSIIEIGVFSGLHAEEMINCAQKFNKKISYYGFDLFEGYTEEIKKTEGFKAGTPVEKDVFSKLKKTGAKVQLFKGFTTDTLSKFVQENNELKVDFIFIDGGHSPETIRNDWFWCQKLMHEQTVVLFDDYLDDRFDFGCKNLIDNELDPKFKSDLLLPKDIFPEKRDSIVKVTFK